VGAYGPILKTTDGGQNWDTVHNPTNGILSKIRYFDPDHPITIGYLGEIMLSSDGGLTWNNTPTICTSTLADICIIDSLHAWVVGYSDPVVLKTDDRGSTWTIINTGIYSDFKSVNFINNLEGWISATGIVLHTMDGGLNWESYPVVESGNLLGIHFFDPLNGSGFNHSYRYFTTDGGQTWDKETIPYNRWINAVWYKDQHSAWLAGQGGTVLLWSDTINVSLPHPPVPKEKLLVFPNPASDFIQLSCDQFGDEMFPARFSLINILGIKVMNLHLTAKQQSKHIYLPQTSNGLYIGILETSDNQKYFVKIYIKN
jgi:Photosynthesis system II assembly factor YCF48/Secretion system C-terminal sorting domain/BNR/Asp-box repeat